MHNLFTERGFAALPILLAALVVIFGGLSGYLIYSNQQLKNKVEKNELLTSTTTETMVATSSAVIVDSTATLPKKVESPAQKKKEEKNSPAASAPAKAWAALYDDMADLEQAFFADFNFINWDVLLGQTNIDLQKRLVGNSIATLLKLESKIVEGKANFPSQLSCLNKEQEAVDSFEIALNNSIKFFDYSAHLMKSDQIDADLKNKAAAFALRSQNKEYDKALQALEELKSLVGEAKSNLLNARAILQLKGADDYADWADAYLAGLNEIYGPFKAGNYDYKPTTDFVTIGEMKDRAATDLSGQFTEWTVVNVNTILVAAGKSLSESNQLCSKE